MMTAAPVVAEVFAAVPLLRHLNARQLSRLAGSATLRAYRPGAVIVREGDTGMSFYVILTGRVQVERMSSGGRLPVAELGQASFFGEMGLIDDQPRSATIVALEPTECALLAKWDFQNALRDDPEIALALLPVLNGRIRDLEARLARAAGTAATAAVPATA